MGNFSKAILIASVALCLYLPAFSQNISLKISDITVKDAIEQLKEKTGYAFVFSSADVDTNKRVSIMANEEDINNVIKQILHGQNDLSYEIKGKKIIIKKTQPVDLIQKIEVTGKVVDANGEPIIGATIKEQGTSNGAISDIDGNFSFETADNANLEVSYIGYQNRKIKVQKGKVLAITLQEDTEMLDEVVVVGYGTVKKANVVGSIAKINSDVIQDRPVGRAEQALQGQMAGVSVRSTSGAPGSDITINVRGAASINGESTPLYVVDGVPIDNLSGINPNDIESIDVLKDAASAAIYGSRGSNGVVLVTTKKGKTGAPVITLNAYTAISTLEKKVDVMDSNEWIAFNKKWYDYQWMKASGMPASTSQADRIAYAETKLGKKLATRDALKENGIGRPSTRAAIIETLFKRNYIRKEKKNLIATPTGVELIQLIHEELLKSAELTGIWEKKLREIEKKTYDARQFLEELKQMVSEIVNSVLSDNTNRRITIQEATVVEEEKKKKEPKRRERKSATPKEKKGKSEPATVDVSSTGQSVRADALKETDSLVGKLCPVCGKGVIIKGKTAYGCSEWKNGCTYRKAFE